MYEISSCLVFEPNKIGKPDVSHEGHLVQYELQEHLTTEDRPLSALDH